MKKILVMLVVILPGMLFADSGRVGIGVNYPGVGVRYGISPRGTCELKAQFGDDIFVIGPRYYRHISSQNKLAIFAGGEVSYLTFKGDVSEGSGFVLEAFVGGEYFVAPNFGVSLDIGPAYIGLKDKDTDEIEGGVDGVINLGLTYYFRGGK